MSARSELRETVILGPSQYMAEVAEGSVDLIVTSPPYWHLKDYGIVQQIGYGQTLHAYLTDLYRVWLESFRVLRAGGRLCVNIGDQFARSVVYGRYKVIPIHAEIITQAERIGFDYMGSLIWQKKTTMQTTGGAVIMGSFPYTPSWIVELDYEYILLFKKPGPAKRVPQAIKEASKLSRDEWKTYFSGHWRFGGARQIRHEAMFPEELPRRLTKMFSFVGDTILDPFLGSGTTMKVALALGRCAIGYEVNKAFLPLIQKAVSDLDLLVNFQIIERPLDGEALPAVDYTPSIQDAKPLAEPTSRASRRGPLYKVTAILDEYTLELDGRKNIRLLGIQVMQPAATLHYLRESVLRKEVFLRLPKKPLKSLDTPLAYVYLKNGLFVNAYLIKAGLALPDPAVDHVYKTKFLTLSKQP